MPRSWRRRACGVVLFCVPIAGVAGTWPPHPQQPPVFRTNVDAVQVDVTVLDADGNPVRGLQPADFAVFEDGQRRPIVGFWSFDAEALGVAASTPKWTPQVASDVVSNDVEDDRLFVLVLDDALIPHDPGAATNARKIARDIIQKLGPRDLMAVVFTADSRGAQDFTRDRGALLAAVEKFSPGLAEYQYGYETGIIPPPEDTDAHWYESSVETVRHVAEILTAVPNRRKVLFWVSPGVPLDVEQAIPEVGGRKSMSDIMRTLATRTWDMFRAAQRANLVVYPIDPTGLGGFEEFVLRQRVVPRLVAREKAALNLEFLRTAAANTGGRAIVDTNVFDSDLTRVFRESDCYYVIGFSPRETGPNAGFRRVEVKVDRAKVQVRARSGYDASPPKPPRPAKDSPESVALAEAIGGVLPNRGLAMQGAVAPFAVPGRRTAAVAVTLGLRQAVPTAAATARVTETTELRVAAFSSDGTLRQDERRTLRAVLRSGSTGEWMQEVVVRVDLPPGRYQVRCAAYNVTSRATGSVFVDVTVPDFEKEPLSMSAIVLHTEPVRLTQARNELALVLPVVPTSARIFAPTDRVHAFLRVYGNEGGGARDASITVRVLDEQNQVRWTDARRVTLGRVAAPAATALNPGAKSLHSGLPPMRGSDPSPQHTLYVADLSLPLPLDQLSRGLYVLIVEARLDNSVVGRGAQFTLR
jgi:VWFA-related protein